jgi:mRNA degradation ribonuclease J1/J2
LQVRVLGAHNLETDTTHHTCFLIDGVLAIDAGSIATTTARDEQIELRHVLLTHLHFDHTRDIPSLALQTLDEPSSIDVYSLKITLDSVHDHMLDGKRYPDLSLPLNDTPAATNFREINDADAFPIGEYSVKPIPVLHPLPTIGYIISSPTESIAYTGQPGVDEHH